MERNNNTQQRSEFAASAYAHAERRNRRRQMFYYDDDTIDGGVSLNDDVVEAEFQPLAGASVAIIANTSKNDKVTNPHTLKLMEERESLGCAVESMGGNFASTLNDAGITHAIWLASDGENSNAQRQLSHLSSETLVKLNTCMANNIPVVGQNWLLKIGELQPGQHWSEVNVEDHIPRTVQLFYDVNSKDYAASSQPHAPHSAGGSASSNRRRDATQSLSASIGETYRNLLDENPGVMEEEALQRAMEMSLLDFALVHRTQTEHNTESHGKKTGMSKAKYSPHDVLRVSEDATPSEIRNAYKKRALETHPDKGGKPGEFESVARAYRLLLSAANSNTALGGSFDEESTTIPLRSSAHWDTELKEHRNLVREMFGDGQDLKDHQQRQNFALERLGLHHKDAGSRMDNEKDEMIQNSCFYLSLASSYLSGIGALAVWDKSGHDLDDGDRTLLQGADDVLIKETALQLKRMIEAAVLSAHPEWAASGQVGENVQAFSDFLVYTLESQTIVSDWAVVVFDDSSGFVDIYKGRNYKDDEEGPESASNTLTLRFVPGHYQPLVGCLSDTTRPSLKTIMSVLEECGVLYVLTDGRA